MTAEKTARALEKQAPRLTRLSGGPKDGVVAVSFLPNRALRTLKKKYLKKDAEYVDVLAFPEPSGFPHPELKGKFLGEIYLNRSLLRGSARQLHFLFIHGLLHLVGFRHHRKGDTMKMRRAEEKLLSAFGRHHAR